MQGIPLNENGLLSIQKMFQVTRPSFEPNVKCKIPRQVIEELRYLHIRYPQEFVNYLYNHSLLCSHATLQINYFNRKTGMLSICDYRLMRITLIFAALLKQFQCHRMIISQGYKKYHCGLLLYDIENRILDNKMELKTLMTNYEALLDLYNPNNSLLNAESYLKKSKYIFIELYKTCNCNNSYPEQLEFYSITFQAKMFVNFDYMLKKIINKELEEVDSLKGYKQLRTLLMYINLGLNEKYSRQFRQVEANLEHKNRADSYSYILNAPDGFNMLARYFCEANYSELNCELAYFELIWKTKC